MPAWSTGWRPCLEYRVEAMLGVQGGGHDVCLEYRVEAMMSAWSTGWRP